MDTEILEKALNEIQYVIPVMGQFQYWKTKTVMKIQVLDWYLDVITVDASETTFHSTHRMNQESHSRSVQSVQLV